MEKLIDTYFFFSVGTMLIVAIIRRLTGETTTYDNGDAHE